MNIFKRGVPRDVVRTPLIPVNDFQRREELANHNKDLIEHKGAYRRLVLIECSDCDHYLLQENLYV